MGYGDYETILEENAQALLYRWYLSREAITMGIV